jgi:WD40 repeat protein
MERFSAVAFSPDGRMIALMASRSIHLVDVRSGRELALLSASPLPGRLAFSPDGQTLAVGGWNKAVHLWEVPTGKEIRTIGELDHVNALAFAPDGRTLAAASGWRGGAIHLLDVATGQPVRKLQGHDTYIGAVAFAPDGKTLASGQRDTTVLVWDVAAATQRSKPAEPPAAQQLDQLWADLAQEDVSTAHAAMWTLTAAGETAVRLFQDRLQPAPPPDAKRLQELIAELDSTNFAARETASRELEKLGMEAQPALRRVLEGKPSAELRRRVEALLAAPSGWTTHPPESLRRMRVIVVLERIGTAQVAAVLKTLVQGDPAARATQAAQAALERLATRAAVP